MPTCSVVIPVYNRASVTRQCLRSLLDGPAQGIAEFEIVVVDDASTDQTESVLEAYSARIRVVRHATNAGFATACNDGAAVATGRYVVFLNNDTIPQSGWLDALVTYAEDRPAVAAVGSKLLFSDGTIQHAGVAIGLDRFPWHIYTGFPAHHPAVNTSRRVPIVTGACMLIRREVFDAAGGFDSAFRNGYEDVDLCLRLGERGQEIHYCHRSVLYHLEAATREGQNADAAHNLRLYRERWFDRVVPNDFQYYAADGLVRAKYTGGYPFELAITPEVATINTSERERLAGALLKTYARTSFDVQRQLMRLNVRAQEAELRGLRQSTLGRTAAGVVEDAASFATPRLLSAGTPVPISTSGPRAQLVSVVLAVRNNATQLRQLLPRIREQKADATIELIAFDAGSSDDSVDVLREFKATVFDVRSEAFSCGLARALAARFGEGSVVVLVSPRALPLDGDWLANLIAPLAANASIAAASSRILPRPDADLLTRREAEREPNASPDRSVRTITDWDTYRQLHAYQLRDFLSFSLISAAIRRDVLERIPFGETVYTGHHDLHWARDVLEAGWSLQYEPASRVQYSPGDSLTEVFQRSIGEGQAEHAVCGRRFAAKEVDSAVEALIDDDWRTLEQMLGPDAPDLRHLRVVAACRRTANVLGRWQGVNSPAMQQPLSTPADMR